VIEKILGDKFEKYFDFLNEKMIQEQIVKRGVKDERVLAAMARIKRHLFLPDALRSRAYDDYAIELYPGQTISQPYITALMTELLRLKGGEKILEIGTGTGYQTALLAELGKEVFSIDIKKELYELSLAGLLKAQKAAKVKLKTGDGREGWLEFSPFDRIILTCAVDDIPEALFGQLAENGLLLAPVGAEEWQSLKIYEKAGGKVSEKAGIAVKFVRML